MENNFIDMLYDMPQGLSDIEKLRWISVGTSGTCSSSLACSPALLGGEVMARGSAFSVSREDQCINSCVPRASGLATS